MIGDMALRGALEMVERGLVPDAVVRAGIRRLCRERLREEAARPGAARGFIDAMRQGPVAPVPAKANEQHYELPAEFFALVLGARRKYSGCHWPDADTNLDAAEESALAETGARAGLADGMSILELGCGWGSLSLWMAERYPASRITAVSNSASQRRFIEEAAARRGLANLRLVTADMNDFRPEERFDRIVSVEMFEHMRNYDELLRRVASWLASDGRLFVHVFCHRSFAYPFETDGASNWMGRHFFTGGLMPSADLFAHFPEHVSVAEQWWWDGTHYERTANAWLENLDRRRAEVMPILASAYGAGQARRWLQRWRVFFMACAELFGYDRGREWGVRHALLEPAATACPAPDRSLATVS